jgi:hypothetical protein
MYRHIVLTKLYDGADDADFLEVVHRLVDLGSEPGIIYWKVNESIDTRKGAIIVTDAAFVDEAAFEAFKISEAHKEAGEFIKNVADWWVGDYLED